MQKRSFSTNRVKKKTKKKNLINPVLKLLPLNMMKLLHLLQSVENQFGHIWQEW